MTLVEGQSTIFFFFFFSEEGIILYFGSLK